MVQAPIKMATREKGGRASPKINLKKEKGLFQINPKT